MGRLKAISLFCGCGGMDLGLIGGFTFLNQQYGRLPFDIECAIDNDKYAVEIYNNNFDHHCFIKDVKDLNHDVLPDHDILIGGFPCQSFSIVAQNPPRLGIKDEKGQLFFEMCRVLNKKRPRFFIAENVKGILSANKKEAFPLIIKNFEDCGYKLKYKLLDASDFGIPQKRQRVFIIGFKNQRDYDNFSFPVETTLKNKIPLKTVLEDVVNEKYFFSKRAVEGMKRVQSKMNKGRAQNVEIACNTISAHLSKVSLNSTDPVLFENERYRRFTPREAANIQSFPLEFKFDSVSENRQYKAIGNAVPPVLMWHISNSLIKLI
ncbi:DNA cytosine methyltransferase [Aliarcobacter butzleri]|uniref:DNA cytosine methyltransferase n=1 Tax=Aliarcobacter butzleri TaxID=28197 RepID=UPI0021B3F9ED|nr:DNA (cytosine-5-)-methyltransferase [Aliarcobacter butzleri]MCT7581444.1 DNA (cytosine-5-)-methyltransferase [Aliarcobacter butzleri]